MAAEVQVTQGYTWTEEMGIVMACLVEDEKTHLINWVKEVGSSGSPLWSPLSSGPIGTLGGNIPEEAHSRRNQQG